MTLRTLGEMIGRKLEYIEVLDPRVVDVGGSDV